MFFYILHFSQALITSNLSIDAEDLHEKLNQYEIKEQAHLKRIKKLEAQLKKKDEGIFIVKLELMFVVEEIFAFQLIQISFKQ